MTISDRVLESVYILHARNYRDTSIILEVFSKQTGRYSALAKGARSPRSKLRGQLQPFSPLLMASVGRGDLKTVISIERIPRFYRLTGKGLLLGLYVNELLYRVTGKYEPLGDVFEAYEHLLQMLEDRNVQTVALRGFELSLLQELGYGINFHYDAGNGEQIESSASYRFRLHEGFHRTTDSGSDIFPGIELISIAGGNLEAVNPDRLRFLTRKSLAPLLGDRPLKSRTLFSNARGGAVE